MRRIDWLFTGRSPMIWPSFFMFVRRHKGTLVDDCFKINFEASPRLILSVPSLRMAGGNGVLGKPFNTTISLGFKAKSK